MIGAGIGDLAAGCSRGGFQGAELRGGDHEEDQRLCLRGAYCFTGVKNDGIGHSKVVTSRLVHVGAGGDPLAEIESRIEGVECDRALRPLDGRRKRQPDARDHAVGAPGVQNFVHRLAFVQHHARLRLHGDHFERAHRVEVAQTAVRHRADAARAAAEKSADRGLHDRRGIAAQLPARFARLGFEHAEAHSRLADGDAVRLNLFDLVHAREVEHDAALQRHAWP